MSLQMIFVYITVALAIGYLAKKFVLPKSLFTTKRSPSHGCGQDDCGCH
jgi:hypothetical protein